MENPHFLESYKVDEKESAKTAAKRKETRTGEKGVFKDPAKRIEAYIERLEEIFLEPDEEKRYRRIEIFHEYFLYPEVIIKSENFPESYFEYQKKLAKDRGMGEVSFGEKEKVEEKKKVINSQKLSLKAWEDYLLSDDCKYPNDIKYFVMQGILQLGNFDGVKYSFTKRAKGTTAGFPEIDREALSKVMGALEARIYEKDLSDYPDKLLKLIDNKNSFGDMYAETMHELDEKAEKESLLPIIDGEWIVFEKGTDPKLLVERLAGKRSNLCIADIGAATRYLEQGNLEIYFSKNHAGESIMPRIAVAYDEEKGGVYEVRGTYNKNEDIDPYISGTYILMNKMKDLPKGEVYLKKDECMREVTRIYDRCFREDRKTKEKIYLYPDLTKDELTFIYELNSPIEGFGYQKDPRIEEIRKQRKLGSDLPIIFECSPDQIAYKKEDIKPDTKAYIGEWNPEVMKLIPEGVDEIYEKFPDKRVLLKTIETDTAIQSAEDAERILIEKGFIASDYAKHLLKKTTFSKELKSYNLVSFSVEQLGFTTGAKLSDIYTKAKEFGLELCPAEVGPLLRLQYTNQPNREYLRIAMDPILDRDGDPRLFDVRPGGVGLWLGGDVGPSGWVWVGNDRFVFVRRK